MERQNIQIDLEKEGEAELVTVQYSSTSALKSIESEDLSSHYVLCYSTPGGSDNMGVPS